MSFIQPYNGPSYAELPDEIFYSTFLNLDLNNLLTAQLVCTIWYKISCREKIWKQIAEQKMILLKVGEPIRATVLASFQPYCTIARLLFPNICVISSAMSSAYERRAIDLKIAEIDKSSIHFDEIIAQTCSSFKPSLSVYIPMIQVLKEAGALPNEKFLLALTTLKLTNLSKTDQLVFWMYVFDSMPNMVPEAFIMCLLLPTSIVEMGRIQTSLIAFNTETKITGQTEKAKKEFNNFIATSIYENKFESHLDSSCRYLASKVDTKISFHEEIIVRIKKMDESYFQNVIATITTLDFRECISALFSPSENQDILIGIFLCECLKNSLLAIRSSTDDLASNNKI